MVATKKKKKKPREVLDDTPITVGGGGDGKIPADITINYNQSLWTQTPGVLRLRGGKVKTVSVTFDGVNFQKLPVKGTFSVVVDCKTP